MLHMYYCTCGLYMAMDWEHCSIIVLHKVAGSKHQLAPLSATVNGTSDRPTDRSIDRQCERFPFLTSILAWANRAS